MVILITNVHSDTNYCIDAQKCYLLDIYFFSLFFFSLLFDLSQRLKNHTKKFARKCDNNKQKWCSSIRGPPS